MGLGPVFAIDQLLQADRPDAQRRRAVRDQRGLRRPGAGLPEGDVVAAVRRRASGPYASRWAKSIPTASTSTAARSPWAIRSAPRGARLVLTLLHGDAPPRRGSGHRRPVRRRRPGGGDSAGAEVNAMEPWNRTLRTTHDDADNIVTIWMDVPGKSVNTCSPQFLADLAEALDAIERDRPAGVIFASAKARSFNAGADLFEIRTMTREQIASYLATGPVALRPHRRVCRCRPSPPSTATAWAADSSWRSPADIAWRRTTRPSPSACPKSSSASSPPGAARRACRGLIGLRRALPILLAGKTMPPRKAQRARTGGRDRPPRGAPGRRQARRAERRAVARSRRGSMAPLARLGPARTSHPRRRAPQDDGHDPRQLPRAAAAPGRGPSGYDQGFAAGLEAERRALVELSRHGRRAQPAAALLPPPRRQEAHGRARSHAKPARGEARRRHRRRDDGCGHRPCADPRRHPRSPRRGQPGGGLRGAAQNQAPARR